MAIGQRGVQLLRVMLKIKLDAYHYDTIKRRSVASRYHGSKIFSTETRREKSNRFTLAKQQHCTCITLFFNMCEPSLHDCVRNGEGEHFFFLLRYGRSGLNPRQFRQHLTNLMKVNTIDEVLRIHFLSDVFGLLSSGNFATVQREVIISPLYWLTRILSITNSW